MWKHGQNLHLFFVNSKKDYDSVHTETLLSCLREFGISKQLGNLVKMCLCNIKAKAKLAKKRTDDPKIIRGFNKERTVTRTV